MHVLEVQVFVCGTGLLSLLPGGSSLVRGSLQIIFVVHLDRARQHIVHHHQSDVDASRLDTIQAVKLRQQRARVLVQVLYLKRARGHTAVNRTYVVIYSSLTLRVSPPHLILITEGMIHVLPCNIQVAISGETWPPCAGRF